MGILLLVLLEPGPNLQSVLVKVLGYTAYKAWLLFRHDNHKTNHRATTPYYLVKGRKNTEGEHHKICEDQMASHRLRVLKTEFTK